MVQTPVPHDRSTRRLPTAVLIAALLLGAALSADQLVVPGRAGPAVPAKLAPTAHPPVPADLASMWLVPAQGAKLGPAMTNFVRGVRLLEEDDKPAAALPLLSDAALATTPLADYARYYTGLALAKLDRYAGQRAFSPISPRARSTDTFPKMRHFSWRQSARRKGTTREPSRSTNRWC